MDSVDIYASLCLGTNAVRCRAHQVLAEMATVLGEPADAPMEKVGLTTFLRNHTADDGVLGDAALANRYKALQMFMVQELDGTQVYRVGQGPQVRAYALGRAASGQLVGFKTVLTET